MTTKAMETFKREVEIVKNNSHPNIVRYLGVCAEPGKFVIVMEYIPGGNLEQLLQDPKRKISLYTKMRIAKEVALGMNWLHNAKPQIIHRDLKLTNVLLDTDLSAKICDFGLSQEKFSPFLRDPSTGAKGTPLWMAPEVLRLEPFNEKCDVYSLGILLWCLATGDEPYEDFEEFEPFFRAVCYDDVRPPIPKDLLPSLAKLIEECWHPDSKKRPSCGQIVQTLYHVMIEVAVHDKDGIEFWKENCLDRQSIYWDDFMDLFLEDYVYLPDEPTQKQIEEAQPFQLSEYSSRNLKHASVVAAEWKRRFGSSTAPANIAELEQEFEVKLKCFKTLIVTEGPGDAEMVDLEKFGDVLQWFGPIRDEDGEVRILDRVAEVLGNEGFHGDITAPKAQELLNAYKEPGMYLVRFSSLHGQYAITHLNAEKVPNHHRISCKLGKGFYFREKYYPTITGLIEAVTPVLGLTKPCPGSKYQSIFSGVGTDYLYKNTL
eukprot:CAMPEP_0206194832 /NCGR_PEP_ID=MMETSP0166-20121206/7454_1 /ASSEMBLY_ACC=CAM_ASM_000260 /TAXON_ID=95228 /ORGANISM="Vannella robusta, Strain DIVA3 518/3/11/1/6" /LENGTH=486 /DNA_ID=CAMNT_0053611925 /DNA_START=226 /DNA_END=1686 /DNA_ORIENTATION=-